MSNVPPGPPGPPYPPGGSSGAGRHPSNQPSGPPQPRTAPPYPSGYPSQTPGAMPPMRGVATTTPQPPLSAPPRRREARTVNEPFNPEIIDAIASMPVRASEQPREPGIHVFVTDSQGREQHIVFAAAEVTIGRERNNDLVLAEEGVSRHHAILTADDNGVCSITDLGSTNGTVVNHRHIENVSTPLHARDRVALGQFVLRAVYVPGLGPRPADIDDPPTDVGDIEAYRSLTTGPPLMPQPAAPAEPEDDDEIEMVEARIESAPDAEVEVSSASPRVLEVPLPSSGRRDGPSTHVLANPDNDDDYRTTNVRASEDELRATNVRSSGRPPSSAEPMGTSPGPVVSNTMPAPPSEAPPSPVSQPGEEALAASEPPVAQRAPRVSLVNEALSVLTALLQDGEVRRIDVRQRRILIGGDVRATFDSDDAVAAAVAKVSGTTLHADQPVARASFDEWQLVALMPGASGGHVVSFTRALSDAASLEALVTEGALTSGAAALLGAAVEAQLGILVVGDRSGAASVAHALLGAATPAAHIAWLWSAARDPAPPHATPVDIADDDTRDETWEALAALSPEHVVALGFFGDDMARLLELVARGAEGVIATASGSNLDAALGRAAGSVAAARGMATDAARSWLVASFSIGVEVTRQRSGELRIARLSFMGDGSTPPGHESLIVGGKVTTKARELVEQLRARGFSIDRATIEKR